MTICQACGKIIRPGGYSKYYKKYKYCPNCLPKELECKHLDCKAPAFPGERFCLQHWDQHEGQHKDSQLSLCL
jgi:hypothetical protein